MEWRKWYMDLILVPLGLMINIGYHVWLLHQVRTRPFTTIIGKNSSARRLWVSAIIQDNEKKNILAVQTLRNTIMGSTLMATTTILLCSGLAAVISSTYSVKKPLNDTVYGAHGEIMVSLKYVTVLTIFIFSFICYSLSIRFINQVNVLINLPQLQLQLQQDHHHHHPDDDDDDDDMMIEAEFEGVTPDYVCGLLERGFVMNTVGNRLFYAALPLVLWISGPVLAFLGSLTLVPLLYHLDFAFTHNNNNNNNNKKNKNNVKINHSNGNLTNTAGAAPATRHDVLSHFV